ncbi:MAG: HDOD domain-containing protein [Desulfotignum sp.]|nr:HDOD domain-containing protein [Desulfobacteraceae bacterium]
MTYQKIEHITAGQLKADHNSSDIFQAWLGTCLGVALYDKKTRTGGMIHILLPEPPMIGFPEYPEKYAATGIPLLIQELIRLGSDPKDIKATIAGGALVGPVSFQDMGLDIGGRTTELASTILEDAGIDILVSETGGFFSCTLELDMATGKTVINPPWEDRQDPLEQPDRPGTDDILCTIENLQPIPQTALKILRMFQDSRTGIMDIAQELSRDQVLGAQTLKLCNSALFSGTARIDTLKDAILLLGEDMLIKSIITAAVNKYYNQIGTGGYSLCKGGLFFHAVGVAATAEKLADKTGIISGKQAYTAGLLHDIGKVVLDQFVSAAIPLFFRDLTRGNKNLLQSEKTLLGITHCQTGALLARQWKFSSALSQVIVHHHEPEKAVDHKDLVCIVYLADLLMERFSTGLDIEKMQTGSVDAVMKRLGITPFDILELVDTIPMHAIKNQEIVTR